MNDKDIGHWVRECRQGDVIRIGDTNLQVVEVRGNAGTVRLLVMADRATVIDVVEKAPADV